MLFQFTLKNLLGISGKMNAEDSGKVGNKLADSVRILAACFGLAALIYAIRWW